MKPHMSPRAVVAAAIAVAGLGILLQPPLGPFAESLAGDVQRLLERPRIEAARRPARALPLRPGDTERYPRDGFGFVLASERGARPDTRAGTMTVDRIEDADTTITVRLTEAELDTLYREAIAIRLFDELTLDPQHKDDSMIIPDTRGRLEVRAGSVKREFSWNNAAQIQGRWADGSWASGRAAEDWKRLWVFERHAWQMAPRRDEDFGLPPAKGFYR